MQNMDPTDQARALSRLQGEKMERSPVACRPSWRKTCWLHGLWLCSFSIPPARGNTIPKQCVPKTTGLDENDLAFNSAPAYKNSTYVRVNIGNRIQFLPFPVKKKGWRKLSWNVEDLSSEEFCHRHKEAEGPSIFLCALYWSQPLDKGWILVCLVWHMLPLCGHLL